VNLFRQKLAPICAALALAIPARAARAEASQAASAKALLQQERRLSTARRALDRLASDKKRRRFRDAWVAVIREADAAVRALPSGPRAAEARLLAARAREQLWSVSRSKADGRSAVASYRQVDEGAPGTALAARALLAAAKLARVIGSSAERESVCRRLSARYGGTDEQKAACPRAAEPARKPAAPAGPPPAPAAGKPIDPDDDETAGDDEPPKPPPAGAPKLSAKAEARAARDAPPTPHREPDTDVPAEAARLMEQLVQRATRAVPQAAPPEESETAEEAEALHEPDAPKAPPERVAAEAKAEEEEDPDAADKARALRKAALTDDGVTLAAELGLKVKTVVIDAGHGGKDTGAIGRRGLREKDVSLAIAERLRKRLRALGLNVVLTRDSDRFVSLDERTRIANEAKADLFVSIHCNAARGRRLSGIETWTLNVGSGRYAKRLAAFENADSPLRVSDLRLILADLAKKANASDARELARAVQSSLIRTVRARVGKVNDHGIKQALFYVLLGTRMPSILVETAFLSNPAEEARLRSGKYQEAMAEAIARGVKDFVDGRQRLARAP
jgi:N-acetylmuramoyl-L-alanine amidase